MATVLRGVLPKSSVLLCFFWVKGLNAKGIHNEIFPAYGGKFLSHKAFHNWIEKFSQRRSKIAYDGRPGRPVEIATEAIVQPVEELIRSYRRITIDSVAIGQMYRWWRIWREINVFFKVRISHHL
jgi:hypothetical protein